MINCLVNDNIIVLNLYSALLSYCCTMSAPVVTVRELKNTESGVDISVPNYKETTGLFSTAIDFNIVVVSRLRCFKLSSHRDSDTVQFMVTKKYEDFEALLKSLQFTPQATSLPKLPRLYFGLNEVSGREMQVAVDALMKAIAVDPILVTSESLLRFLGIDPVKVAKIQVLSSSTADNSDLIGDIVNGDDERAVMFAEQEQETGTAQDVDWLTSSHKSSARGDLFSGEEGSIETKTGAHNTVNLAPGWRASAGDKDDDDDLDTILQSPAPVSDRGLTAQHKAAPVRPVIKPKPKTSASVSVTQVDKLAVEDIVNYIAINQTSDDVDLFS